MGNKNMHIAKKRKKDCFYTLLKDIEEEISFYPKEQFYGKTIYLNCDTTASNFYKYFCDNFENLKLKKVIATCIKADWKNLTGKDKALKVEYFGKNKSVIEKELTCDQKYEPGDFRSKECLEIMKEADTVVTNPPFSIFREFFALILKYKKQFLAVFNKNAIGSKEIFPYFANKTVWLGVTKRSGTFYLCMSDRYEILSNNFKIIDGKKLFPFGNIEWCTNLHHTFVPEFPDLSKNHYSPKKYPKYDNYDAINVDKVSEIPCDYPGVMGVPLTFMDKWSYG